MNKELNEKVNATVAEMKAKIAEIEAIAEANKVNATDENKQKIDEIKNHTIDVINEAILKIEEQAKNENFDFETILNKVSLKCKEATQYTINKINQVKNNADLNNALNDLKNQAHDLYQSIKTNEQLNQLYETVKNETNKIINSVDEYIKSDETQANIQKAKDKTIELAEKSVDKLKELLNGKQDNNETNNNE